MGAPDQDEITASVRWCCVMAWWGGGMGRSRLGCSARHQRTRRCGCYEYEPSLFCCFGRFGCHFLLAGFAAAGHLFRAESGKLYALVSLLCAWMCLQWAFSIVLLWWNAVHFSWFSWSRASVCSICMPFVSWRFLFTMLLVLSKMFMDSLITYMVVGVSLEGSVTFKSPALKFLVWSDTRKGQ